MIVDMWVIWFCSRRPYTWLYSYIVLHIIQSLTSSKIMGTLSTNPKKLGFTGLFCGSFNPVYDDPHNNHIIHNVLG